MAEHQIAEVPERIWLAGKKVAKTWSAQYNVAGWINVISGQGSFSLVARYQDTEGVKEVVIDSATASGAGALLLSNKATFQFSGKAKNMVLLLITSDAAARFSVDELYMQDAQAPQSTQSKLVAAY